MATKTKQWTSGTGSVTIEYGGQGDGQITITSDANNLFEARSMQITIQTTSGSPQQTKTITVNQAAKVRIDISSAIVTASNQTYSGSAKTPTPTVTLNGVTVPSSGYDIAYSNNINAGIATITVTGKGDYTGTASGTFTIAKKSRTMFWSSYPSSLYVGRTGTLSATSSDGSGDGNISYSSGTPSTASVSGSIVTAVASGTCVITATISEGTNYLSASISYTLTVKSIPSGFVDMGLSVFWAEKNIGATSIYSYDSDYFSWGNVDGHVPTSDTSFSPYDWGRSNDAEPYVSSSGATLTGDIPLSNDAAYQILGSPSRMPKKSEFNELFNNVKYINSDGSEVSSSNADKRVTVNGIVGLYLESKINGNRLFIPCTGHGGGTSWNGSGNTGRYWTSTKSSSVGGYSLDINPNNVNPNGYNYKFYGFTIRPVIDVL